MSPAQLFLFRTKSMGPKKKALEIFNPKTEADYSVDIVAVHGLASNPETAWTSRLPSNNITTGSSQAMWLRDWLTTEKGLNARIMAFNHNTSWDAYALDKSLHDHGDDLLRALETVRQDEAMHRPIIFIGHSFGGLIIKQALVNAGADSTEGFCRSIRQKVCGFIFLGTPHKGARITLAGEIVSLFGFWSGSSTSLLEVTKPESATNQSLHNDFMSYLQSDGPKTKNTVCVFEAIKQMFWGIPIINVVDKTSAIIDGSHKVGFETDHRNMQRISDREDERYMEILRWISRWVKKAKAEAEIHHNAKTREKTQEQQECLKSLYFLNMEQREYLVQSAATNTCTWLLDHKKYTTWLARPHTLLWIAGKPGAGKSTLIRYALQKVSCSEDAVASFFFNGRGSDLQKSSYGLFRSLLHQLLDQIPEMMSDFILLYKKKRDTKQKSGSDCEWYERELQEFLEKWILSTSRERPIQVYVDALDEGGEDVAVKLVQYFEELIGRLSSTSASFKVCFSCRHHPVLAPENVLKICVEDENDQDIAIYVRQSLVKHHFSDPVEAQKLEQDIVRRASCVFQWVVLIIPIVAKSKKEGASSKKISQEIEKTPGGLNDLYEQILCRIEDQKRGAQLMQWICFALRPLSLEELRYAMVVDITNDFASLEDCQGSVDFAENDEQMEKTVNSLSGGLAETVNLQSRRTVHFIHQSVKDYLTSGGLQKLDTSFFHDVNHYLSQSHLPTLDTSLASNLVGLAHFRISRSCVKYLTLEEVVDEMKRITGYPRESRSIDINCFPFLDYTVKWASHAEIVEKLQIPQSDLLHLSRWPSGDLIESIRVDNYGKWRAPLRTLLGIASQFGLVSIIKAMFISDVSFDCNERDRYDHTPLSWAAAMGQEAVVQLLIDQPDVEKDSRDRWGRSPLSWAAAGGHEAVVKLLIDQPDVENDSRDGWGQSPLSWAAEMGQEAVVRLLIDQPDIENDAKGRWGETPLSWAARKGHEAVVQLLIDQPDVKKDSRDKLGQTPLSMAAREGHEAVVQLLIDHPDVQKNSRDEWGQSPLSWAAKKGHEAVVQLLIDQPDIEKDSRDGWGQSPLSWAAAGGHEAVVKLLIDHPDVDKNSSDEEGRTPLSWAADWGHEAVVQLLIDHLDVKKNSRDKLERTPLSRAAEMGQEAVVQLLIDHPDVDKNSRNKLGQTPLLMAAREGHGAVVQLLIDHPDVEKDSRDGWGQSPLWWAAARGHEAVVKLLIDHPEVQKDSRDDWGRTPLSMAATEGHGAVVQLLIDHPDVEKNSRDKEGRTPLFWAVKTGREAIVRLLIDSRDDVEINMQDIMQAQCNGNRVIVKLLDIEILRRNPDYLRE